MLAIVRQACNVLGGPPALASAIGVKRQALYQWPKVPPGRVLKIEKATGGRITRHQLRPDLYPVEYTRRQHRPTKRKAA